MALIQCPECEGSVSERAASCPHCGNPLQPATPTPAKGVLPSNVAHFQPVRQRPPDDAPLAGMEAVIRRASFIFSLALFFLSTQLVLTNRRLEGTRPNTVLGIVPTGSERVSFPLANVAAVGTSTRIAVGPLLIGALLVLVGLGSLQNLWPAFLLGLLLVLGAFRAAFYVSNNAGQRIELRIALVDKGKAQVFADEVMRVLADRGSLALA